MSVGTAGNILLHGGLYGVILSSQILEVCHMSLFIENDYSYLHLGICLLDLPFQLPEHGQSLFFQSGAGRFIKYQHHVAHQLFLSCGQ